MTAYQPLRSPTARRLRHRLLERPEDLTTFAAEYVARSQHAADLDYLAKALVRGFYSRDGVLRAGYAVAVSDHRYLAALPPGSCPLDPRECAEGTHI